MDDGTEKEFNIRTRGESTLELCLQTLWLSNPSSVKVTAEIEFHSLNTRSPTLLSSQPITITAAAEFARVGVAAPLRTEQLNPSCSLKSVLRTVRPNNVEITLGSLGRDAEPPSDAALASNADEKPSQIYEMRLSYAFKVDSDKAIEVRPSFPSLFNQLYDSPLDSQIWSLLDSNSKIIEYGSSMHHATPKSLKKGDYVISLLLRHPKYSVLDQMKDIPCEISFNLKDALPMAVYSELDKASTPAVKDDGRSQIVKRLLPRGSYQDIYVARPTADLPKWCVDGDVIVGALTLDKSKESVSSMKLLYIVPPKPKAKSEDSDEGDAKKEESLDDTVFKAKLGHMKKLRAKNTTAYKEIAEELRNQKPLSIPLLSELLSFALEAPLSNDVTNEEQYRVDEIEKIYNKSQKVNGGPIDAAVLAKYFGLNEPDKEELDADEEAKEENKEMKEQRDFLKTILLSRAFANANNTSSDMVAFDNTVKELKQWVKLDTLKDDEEKIKYTLVLARHARLCQGRVPVALSMLLKGKKDLISGKSLKLIDEELLTLFNATDENHLNQNIQESIYCSYPVFKRNV